MDDLELVVLFADADAERFVTKLIERGIERGCLRPVSVPLNAHDPKSSWEHALRAYQLRSSSALFGELATALSLPTVKSGSALGRLATCLVRWFGAEGEA